jgi:hypothetical protein
MPTPKSIPKNLIRSSRRHGLPLSLVVIKRAFDVWKPAHVVSGYRRGLAEAGYVEHRNVGIDYLCVPKTSSGLIWWQNHLTSTAMVSFLLFLLNLLDLPFKSKSQLAAENAALRQQVIVLQRKVRGRVQLTDKWSPVLHSVLSLVSVGSERHHDRPARDAAALASRGPPSLLALEIQELRRTATHLGGIAGVDPAHESWEQALGSAAHPWRVAQAGLHGGTVNSCQIYGQAGWRSFGSKLGHLPAQPSTALAAMDLFVVPTITFVQIYVLVIVRLARRELDRLGCADLVDGKHHVGDFTR